MEEWEELTENGARQREGGKNEFRECHGESMKKLASLNESQLLYKRANEG
jgi:hypothetical protein